MVIPSIFRHLFNDDESLSTYLEGNIVSLDDIKRRMFLKERSENRFIPDQFYSILGNEAFRDIKLLNDVLGLGIYNLAGCYLEFRNNRIHVQQKMQNEWQRLITYIPPLYIQCAFLQFQKPLLGATEEDIL